METSKELELFIKGNIEALKQMRDNAFMENDTILYIRCNALIDALEMENANEDLREKPISEFIHDENLNRTTTEESNKVCKLAAEELLYGVKKLKRRGLHGI